MMELYERYREKLPKYSLNILIWTIYKIIFVKAVTDKSMDDRTWWKIYRKASQIFEYFNSNNL